jgi:site-specific DNA-methyltransferase (adenine-specific)
VAAKELGRFFVGAEVEREYAELGARRIGAAERGIKLGKIRAIASFTGASYLLLVKSQR